MPSVLVTGAGRGIGLAITEHMSRRGWDVYATARSSDALQSIACLPNVHAIALDITDRAAIATLPDLLPPELNGVVNNAGIVVNGPVEGLALDDLTRQFDVNVTSQIAVTQAVLPKIRASHGRVLFISSVSGLFTTPGTGAYNASKYAIESLADALRMELRPWKIPVSLIEPGPIRTDMWADVLEDHDRMAEHLGDEHRRLYASHLAGTRKLLGRMQKNRRRSRASHEGRRSRADIAAPQASLPARRRKSRPEGHRRNHADRGQRRDSGSGDHFEMRLTPIRRHLPSPSTLRPT